MLADGVEMLLQHPTIRDLDLTVECSYRIRKASQLEGYSVFHFERCVAEGLRATSLRRFHLTVEGKQVEMASTTALTKMYENARGNWSLMDIRLKGQHWFGVPCRALPFLWRAFRFISLRNQYFAWVDENAVPPGLWPLILEWCHLGKEKEWHDESALFYVLTRRPYLVTRERPATEKKSVDGPSPKRTRVH